MAQPLRHFLSTLDWSRQELTDVLNLARQLRARPIQPLMQNRSVALLFFNPSMRTRTSFTVGAQHLGAMALVLEPGKGAWPIAFEDGGAMLGEEEEHVREVARVLSRYVDLICVRAFPKFKDWQQDRMDTVVNAFAQHATVPVINMETITHPCQELALMMALQDRLGTTDGKKFVLTWTYHPKPLNTAVANSALIIAAKFGFDVTLVAPTDAYRLDERYMNAAEQSCRENGRKLTFTTDLKAAYQGADMVYAKSWGALPFFGRWDEEKPIRDAHKHFMVDMEKMNQTPNAFFSHCLPVRRNVKVTDEVLDSPRAIHIDEAENRLHVQKALMARLSAQLPSKG